MLLALSVSHLLFHFFLLSLICNVTVNIVVLYSICEAYNRIVSIQFLTLPLFLSFFSVSSRMTILSKLVTNDHITSLHTNTLLVFLIFQSLYTFDKLSPRYTYHRFPPNKFNRWFAYFISIILKIHKMSF